MRCARMVAWWVTGFTEDPPIPHGTAEEGRQQSDELWKECCTIVFVDVENDIQPEISP